MAEQQLQPLESLTEPLRIVVIAAHPDDIEFGTAGSVARWVEEGAEVTYVIVTDGSSGSNEPGIVRQELVAQREKEQLAAAQVVGVSDVRFLGYPDGTLEATIDLRRDLTRIIREIKPDRVVCSDPTTVFFGDGYINHPDHRAAAEAAVYATFPSSETRPIFPELLEEGYEPHKVKELFITLTPHATHFLDITGTMEKKIDTLRAHVSQLGAGEAFENGVNKWVREFSAEAGKQCGVTYAETFKVMTLFRADEAIADKNLETVDAND
jgi:LmbE family N-acetylglucosaminyl deacetylase